MQFSFFTSTYNRSSCIERFIQSLRSQTYSNWELIVVNDGSIDNTADKLTEWSILDNRIKAINYIDNCGHPAALFNAKVCKQLKGDFVIFLGSDDWLIDEDCLVTILKTIQSQTQEFWKFGFTWIHEHTLDEMQVVNNLPKRVFSSEEVIQDSYPDADFVFVYRKQYWDAFDSYFDHPDKFFSAFYDVALNHHYLEAFFNIPVVVAGWGDDNVTKGNNEALYFRWSLMHRLYMVSRYGDRMGINYLSYTMRSISLSAFLPYSTLNQSLALALKSMRLAVTFMGTALLCIMGALWPFKSLGASVRKRIQASKKRR